MLHVALLGYSAYSIYNTLHSREKHCSPWITFLSAATNMGVDTQTWSEGTHARPWTDLCPYTNLISEAVWKGYLTTNSITMGPVFSNVVTTQAIYTLTLSP